MDKKFFITVLILVLSIGTGVVAMDVSQMTKVQHKQQINSIINRIFFSKAAKYYNISDSEKATISNYYNTILSDCEKKERESDKLSCYNNIYYNLNRLEYDLDAQYFSTEQKINVIKTNINMISLYLKEREQVQAEREKRLAEQNAAKEKQNVQIATNKAANKQQHTQQTLEIDPYSHEPVIKKECNVKVSGLCFVGPTTMFAMGGLGRSDVWVNANNYCKNKGMNLPTKSQLITFYNYVKTERHEKIASYMWASDAVDGEYAYALNFESGEWDRFPRDDTWSIAHSASSVVCVKNINSLSPLNKINDYIRFSF